MTGGARFDPGFGGAVEEDDGQGEPEEAEARGEGHEVKEVKDTLEIRDPEEVNTSGHRHICSPIALDFGEGFGTALADLGVARIFADVCRVVPAAFAFSAVGAINFDGQTWQGFGGRGSRDRG